MISPIWDCSYCKNSISTINIKDDFIYIKCVNCNSYYRINFKSHIEHIYNGKGKAESINNKDSFCNIYARIKKLMNIYLLILRN